MVKPSMIVTAVPGRLVFFEGQQMRDRVLDENGQDLKRIPETESIEVPDTRYYRRRIAAGDLIRVPPAGKRKAKEE